MKLKILYAALLKGYGWKLCYESGNINNIQLQYLCVDSTGAPYFNMGKYWNGS